MTCRGGRPRHHPGDFALSACCWIPLLAIALGFSAGGIAVALERVRWPFLGATLAFLALGLYLNERRAGACGPDGTCPKPRPGLRRFNRVVLSIAAGFVLLLVAFPNDVGRLTRFGSSGASPIGAADSILTIGVHGMTCSGCEASVESALRSVPGVKSVDADFDRESAMLHLTGRTRPTPAALAAALSRAGYQLANASDASSGANVAGRWKGRLPVSGDKTARLALDVGPLATGGSAKPMSGTKASRITRWGGRRGLRPPIDVEPGSDVRRGYG